MNAANHAPTRDCLQPREEALQRAKAHHWENRESSASVTAFSLIAETLEQSQQAVAKITLYDDFSILYGAAGPAFGLQDAGEFQKIFSRPHKTLHESYLFAGTTLALKPQHKPLGCRRKSLLLGFGFLRILKVRVCRIDHTQTPFPIVVCHNCNQA